MLTKYFMIVICFLLLTGSVDSAMADDSEMLISGPWTGKIIDIETKEPIEGAVVVAVWYRVWRNPAGGVSSVYNTKEVLTDKDGKFEMTSYTPINMLPILSYMRGPEFTIFKPGYLSLSGLDLSDYIQKGANKNPVELKEWRLGKAFRLAPGIIELPKLKTREERLKSTPGHITEARDKTPILNRLIDDEDKALGIK